MTDSITGREKATGQRPGKRERLVAAAVELLYQQGVERTTLADIAHVADVPPGNVYYYFKTRDDVIAAVVETHTRQLETTLALIESAEPSPRGRLKSLVDRFADRSTTIAEYGCPIGTLCSELHKRGKAEIVPAAELLRIPIAWAGEQFRALGRADAHDLALELMAAYEGSALLANTLHEPVILQDAARRLHRWIDTL